MSRTHSERLARQQRLRAAIIAGLQFAREHLHDPKDADIAICIEVQLREAGFRLPLVAGEEAAS